MVFKIIDWADRPHEDAKLASQVNATMLKEGDTQAAIPAKVIDVKEEPAPAKKKSRARTTKATR